MKKAYIILTILILIGVTAIKQNQIAKQAAIPPIITSLSPGNGILDTGVSIAGEGLNYGERNYIQFGQGQIGYLTPSYDGTMRFKIPPTIVTGCKQLEVLNKTSISCKNMTTRNLTPGTYEVSVFNSNGKSNKVSFTLR